MSPSRHLLIKNDVTRRMVYSIGRSLSWVLNFVPRLLCTLKPKNVNKLKA